MEEEEDVILEGSPLHEEFKARGIPLEVTSFRSRGRSAESVWPLEDKSPSDDSDSHDAKKESTILCDSIAHKILESSLLVLEDEDFISNFVLSSHDNEMSLAPISSPSEGSSSSLGSVLFYSCSIAAVAGTLLLLSDRTKVTAATFATLIPAGIAAIASGPTIFKRPKPSEEFLRVLSNLLEDMKVFKILARKTLSLLQGMELLQTNAFLPPVNSSHGGMDALSNGSGNASFPALRSAAYKCTVDLIRAYRGAVRNLLEVSPLADHIDYHDHYIAFVELENFKIVESSLPSIKSLKDAVQLALIQQSEYLRRFSLTFCDKAREDKKLSKAGVLKQIHELAQTIKKINKKLTNVFEYHQAMGMIQEKSKAHLRLQRPTSLDLIPLKSIYSSLFSSGLHLQNSLLKVRELEKIFENIGNQRSKSKKRLNCEEYDEVLPSEDQLMLWLNGFKEIQKELEACVGCLDDGASHVNSIKNQKDPDVPVSDSSPKEKPQTTSKELSSPILIDDSPLEHIDEVFEAVIDAQSGENTSKEGQTSLLTDEELRRRKTESRVLEELKSVLCQRSAVQERREAEALAKKKGLISPCMNELEIEKAIASQVCSLGSNTSPVNIQSVDIQEKLIKKELAKVMEEINDIEEEIIKTDLALPLNSSLLGSEEFPVINPSSSLSSECLSSSSDTDCSSTCSRDTIKSIREKTIPPLFGVSNSLLNPQKEVSLCSNGHFDSSQNSSFDEDSGSCPKSLSECLRSISTPDLKSVPEGSSQYRTIESSNSTLGIEPVLDRDSDPGSADEMENRVLKVYRRPLRPAAMKKKVNKSNGRVSNSSSSVSRDLKGSYLSKQNPDDIVIPSGPPPLSVLGTSTNSFVSQIKAKAAAFKIALDNEKVFGNE